MKLYDGAGSQTVADSVSESADTLLADAEASDRLSRPA